jgi:hypothetical protein
MFVSALLVCSSLFAWFLIIHVGPIVFIVTFSPFVVEFFHYDVATIGGNKK